MTFAVGHALTAGSYDRTGLERFWRVHHQTPAVGVEVALSLLESELRVQWYSRSRPNYGVRTPDNRRARLYQISIIRGLLAAVMAVSAQVHHRRPSLPVTWGRR